MYQKLMAITNLVYNADVILTVIPTYFVRHIFKYKFKYMQI